MAQLFTIFFFASVLGACVAILWSVVDEHRALILANLPWKALDADRPKAILRSVSRNGRVYWATPSMSSETPSRASTVSPAITL